ncbi:hypothetical protein ACFQMG_32295, partial [Kitasatospora paranensis]
VVRPAPSPAAGPDDHATTLLPPVPGGFDDGPPLGRPYVTAAPPAAGGPGFPAAEPGFPPAPPQRFGPPQPQGFPPPPQGFPQQGFPGAAPTGFPPQGPAHGGQGFAGQGFGGQPAGGAPGYAGQSFGGQAPGGPGGGYEDPGAEEPARRRTPLLVGGAVALVLLLGGGTVWALQGSGSDSKGKAAGTAAPPPAAGGGSAAASAPASAGASPSDSAGASPSAGAGAAAEAKALDALLARGESAKAPIGSAVAKVASCPAKAEIDSAAQVFDDGATQRDTLLGDLAKLDLHDLPGGADAAVLLKSAWQQSGDIDRAYAAWARTVSSQGCSGSTAPNTADRKRANDLNPQATQSKRDFVAKWNAIASTYGLTERTWDRI